MNCVICGDNKWKNVDKYRHKEKGMSLCETCGMVSYPSLWKSEDEIRKYYKKDYRDPPSATNAYSGQRKLHYHENFLHDLIEEWSPKFKKDESGQLVLNSRGKPVIESKGRENIVVGEIGAAFGMVLNWVKNVFPGCEVYGTEWTQSFRRNAAHEFDIELTEEFDYTKKYDLIMSYKVAEHQMDIDKYLRKYVECLKSDGLMYISVPTWFNYMGNLA